jgi:poly(A) polymerase
MAAAVLCHDIGKPPCHDPLENTYYGHDVVGAQMAPLFLDLVDPARRIDRDRVAWCVREHLFWLNAPVDVVRDAPVARRYCRADGWGTDLRVVNLCDGLGTLGPTGEPASAFLEAVQRRIEGVVAAVEEVRRRPRPVLDGHKVMEVLGIGPGPEVGEWLRRVTDTGIGDAAEAAAWLRSQVGSSRH